MEERYHALLQKIWYCALTCEKCASACLAHTSEQQYETCIRLCLDCAEVCTLLARSVKRDSALVPSLLALGEAIADCCAKECDRHQDDHCQQCAAACMLCREACKQLQQEPN